MHMGLCQSEKCLVSVLYQQIYPENWQQSKKEGVKPSMDLLFDNYLIINNLNRKYALRDI